MAARAVAYLADAENGHGHLTLKPGHGHSAEPRVSYRGLHHVHFDLVALLHGGKAMISDHIRTSCTVGVERKQEG